MKKSIQKQNLAALTMALAGACLLGGYEFSRAASYTLFKSAYGVENLALIMALMPLGVMVAVYGYTKLLTAVGARRTLLITSGLAAMLTVLCYLGVSAGFKPAAAFFFILKDVYIVLIVEQLWSFLNSTLESGRARRLNGPITGAISIGAISAGFLIGFIAEKVGTEQLLLLAAASFVPFLIAANYGYLRCGEPKPADVRKAKASRAGVLEETGLLLFKKHPELTLILVLVFSTQAVAAASTLQFQNMLDLHLSDPDRQTAYQGTFYAIINSVAAVFQFVLAPVVLRRMTVRSVHLLVPAIHLAMAVVVLVYPSLYVASAALLLFKSLDYSLFRAAKEILYIPLPFDARYRAKEVIDAFGYRVSKGSTGLLIAAIQKSAGTFHSVYAAVALMAAGVWLLSAGRLGRTKAGKGASSIAGGGGQSAAVAVVEPV